jgi:copper chaperone CopZ
MSKADDAARGITRIVLLIMGMRDNACREQIAEALGRVRGVVDVNVSLMRARAVVAFSPPCSEADLIRAVVRAGFGATVSRDP